MKTAPGSAVFAIVTGELMQAGLGLMVKFAIGGVEIRIG